MIQYVRLKDSETIMYPPEIAGEKKHAEKAWGKSRWVSHDIKKEDDPACFADKLVDGKIVFDTSRVAAANSFNETVKAAKRSDAKQLRRGKAIRDALKNISAEKGWDEMTPFERKCVFRVEGGPTDEELGI